MGNKHGSFQFKPEALAYYRELHPLSEAEKRQCIGRYFQRLGTGDESLIPFDPVKMAQEIGLETEDVASIVALLADAGYLRNAGPRGSKTPRMFQLTQLGAQWALSGSRDDMLLSPTVNVNLNVEIQHVLDIISKIELPPEQSLAYENTAMKLERELNSGKLSWQTVRETLSMAADTQAGAPAVISLIANHAPQILSALQHLVQ